MTLARLKKIDLREAWKHEANDFTKWLALDENLRLLGDELGYGFSLIGTEQLVGNFNCDILAEEENSKNKVVIENQLEITDHDHLGKLITYAAGHSANIVVWVVRNVREEHRKAIDWLNEHTDEEVEFFLVQIELWQIADSPFAPKFEIICKPNNWARSVKEASAQAGLSKTNLDQLEFWTQLRTFATNNGTTFRLQKPSPQHWTNISIGNSECWIALTVNSMRGLIAVELYIGDNKQLYAQLASKKDAIQSGLGESVEWMELPGKKASRIKVSLSGDFNDKSKWPEYFKWLISETEKFRRVFPAFLNQNSPLEDSDSTSSLGPDL